MEIDNLLSFEWNCSVVQILFFSSFSFFFSCYSIFSAIKHTSTQTYTTEEQPTANAEAGDVQSTAIAEAGDVQPTATAGADVQPATIAEAGDVQLAATLQSENLQELLTETGFFPNDKDHRLQNVDLYFTPFFSRWLSDSLNGLSP